MPKTWTPTSSLSKPMTWPKNLHNYLLLALSQSQTRLTQNPNPITTDLPNASPFHHTHSFHSRALSSFLFPP